MTDDDRSDRPKPLAPPHGEHRDTPKNENMTDVIFRALVEHLGPRVVIDRLIEMQEEKIARLRDLRELLPEKCGRPDQVDLVVREIEARMKG